MRRIFALTAAALLVTPAFADQKCRVAKGKFTKCPPAAAAAAPTSAVVKDAKGKCHFASGRKKGQFTKCA